MIYRRQFTLSDQKAFVTASGDSNPLHIDPAFARTVFPGQIVVHGMHAVLWALDALRIPRPNALQVTFLKPILLNEDVCAHANGDTLTLSVARHPMAIIRLLDKSPHRQGPSRREHTGKIYKADGAALIALFPELTQVWGVNTVRGLAGLSTLVGMECPGLYSMFSELLVDFEGTNAPLAFQILREDTRFSRIVIHVDGMGLQGIVEAFDTAPAQEDCGKTVTPTVNEFQGRTALVIGGSSGLGAATARLLAAGGGYPLVTYSESRHAAEILRDNIRAEGGHCDILHLDVMNPASGLDEPIRREIREIYYFASPRIFRRRLHVYQAQDFHDFCRIYIDAFDLVMTELFAATGRSDFRVFYPSSVAVEPPLTTMLEYALAKHSGEILCSQLIKKYPALRICVERLPRIETRQTKSNIRVAAQHPADVMLPIIRKMVS